uniref:Uncharacterized protein n=1 Tax=Anguilla anguilla TaxID=7936 RepID=A0A0E9WPW5_ANGAN
MIKQQEQQNQRLLGPKKREKVISMVINECQKRELHRMIRAKLTALLCILKLCKAVHRYTLYTHQSNFLP